MSFWPDSRQAYWRSHHNKKIFNYRTEANKRISMTILRILLGGLISPIIIDDSDFRVTFNYDDV